MFGKKKRSQSADRSQTNSMREEAYLRPPGGPPYGGVPASKGGGGLLKVFWEITQS